MIDKLEIQITHIDLVFLGNVGPVPGGNTGLPLELDSQRRFRLVIGRPEASHIVSRFSSRERELPRFHLLSAVIAVTIGGSDLKISDREHVQIQEKPWIKFELVRAKWGAYGWLRERETYPDGELMGLGERVALTGVDDAVLADGHGVALDVLGDAFRVARLQVEPQRMRRGEQQPNR